MKNRIIGFCKKNQEGLLYLIFGGLTTLVDFVVYYLSTDILRINYLVSNVFAFITAVLFAFFTNKIFVFKSPSFVLSKVVIEMLGFVGARLLSLAVNMAILFIFVEFFFMDDLVVKLGAGIIVVVMNYGISKHLVFPKEVE